MQLVKRFSLTACSLLLAGTSAMAQEPAVVRGATPPQRGYISASTGATLESETAAAFAVEFADNMGRNAQGYATLSYFDNLATDSTTAELATLAEALQGLTGTPWAFRVRDRGVAFIAGGKFLVPTGTSIRPYVGGGAGVINVKRTITERSRGDLTSAVVGELGFTDGVFNTADSSVTKPIAEAVVGVGIVAGATYIDVGYRHRKAFQFAEPVDFGQFSVGVGYKF